MSQLYLTNFFVCCDCNLFRRYPPSFVEKRFGQFFNNYTSLSSFHSNVSGEQTFLVIRNQLLEIPKARQPPIDTIDPMNNEHCNTQTLQLNTTTATTTEKKPYVAKLILHYTHEKRFESMKRDMHHIYDDVFHHTPVESSKMIVGTRNRRDARNDLIRKRPNRILLQDKPGKSRQSLRSNSKVQPTCF